MSVSPLIITTENVGTLFCVGRNYVAHAKELNNPVPKEPVIFCKTRSTVCPLNDTIHLPQVLNRCDHETEIVVRVSAPLHQATAQQALDAISHYGIGLDLTLREKQTQLKQQSYPWELAKSFANACPISPLIPIDSKIDLQNIEFELTINGVSKQQGNTANMLFSIVDLVVFISQNIPLMPDDLIFTGTPEGVGPLHDGDQLVLTVNGQAMAQAHIVRQ